MYMKNIDITTLNKCLFYFLMESLFLVIYIRKKHLVLLVFRVRLAFFFIFFIFLFYSLVADLIPTTSKSILINSLIKNAILTHQKSTLSFQHVILQHTIYQMFYLFTTLFKYYFLTLFYSYFILYLLFVPNSHILVLTVTFLFKHSSSNQW